MMTKLAALSLALTMVLALGGTVLAEDAASDTAPAETEAAARTTYDAAVDAALAEIVAAGGLTQDAVDSYHALRDAERLLEKIDTSSWTAEQLAAYKKAVSGGSVDETALAELASQGILTEADVAALKLAYGTRVTINDLIDQVDTAKADPALVTAITDARAAYGQALQDAGLFNGGRGNGNIKEGRENGQTEGSRDSNSTKEGRGNRDVKGSRGNDSAAEGGDDGTAQEGSDNSGAAEGNGSSADAGRGRL